MTILDRLRLYKQLIKPGITNMQLMTVSIGFILSANGVLHVMHIYIPLLIGTWLVSAGACSLNHSIEKSVDQRMKRTESRPIPSGRLSTVEVVAFGFFAVVLGLLIHWQWTTLLTTLLSALTVFLYVCVYTPLKKYSWLNTWVGAIPGAMPILGGWAAVVGVLHIDVLPLFLVLFFWQHPHFYGLATMYQEDYAKGGLKMLPVVEPDLSRTKRQSLIYTMLMTVTAYLPLLFHLVDWIYVVGVTLVNGLMLVVAIQFYQSAIPKIAKRLFLASIVYLPVWFLLIVLDRWVYL